MSNLLLKRDKNKRMAVQHGTALLLALLVLAFVVPENIAESLRGRTAQNDVPRSGVRGIAQQTPTAEQVYKNIQLFKGMPASELEPTMAFISGSLGVKCSHCHVNPFSRDDKPTKLTARRMIQMVFDLNKGSFRGEKAVTCFTCHRGNPKPVSVPAVGQNLWQPGSADASKAALPTVEEVLTKYVQSVGGAESLQKVTSRVVKGSRIGADGMLVPEEVYQKAPNKILTVTTYPEA